MEQKYQINRTSMTYLAKKKNPMNKKYIVCCWNHFEIYPFPLQPMQTQNKIHIKHYPINYNKFNARTRATIAQIYFFLFIHRIALLSIC